MQSVTLELTTSELELLGLVPPDLFDRYEEIELLETLRLEPGWRLQLLRVRRRGPLKTAAELGRESRRIRTQYGLQEFELVERRPRTRDYILLVRQRNTAALRRLLSLAGGHITPTAPFRLARDHVIATLRGDERPLRRVLARLRREGISFRVVRATGRPFSATVETTAMTARQHGVLARAWALGYYAIPRRVNLTRLARLSGVSAPAAGKLLRRAERYLVGRFLQANAVDGSEGPQV
jgi:predicted DNA binding protein